MAWGPTGRDLGFIFDDSLYFLNLESGQAIRVTQDDAAAARPTWAPYGAAIPANLAPTEQSTLSRDTLDATPALPLPLRP
jgi:hypothetical protein